MYLNRRQKNWSNTPLLLPLLDPFTWRFTSFQQFSYAWDLSSNRECLALCFKEEKWCIDSSLAPRPHPSRGPLEEGMKKSVSILTILSLSCSQSFESFPSFSIRLSKILFILRSLRHHLSNLVLLHAFRSRKNSIQSISISYGSRVRQENPSLSRNSLVWWILNFFISIRRASKT